MPKFVARIDEAGEPYPPHMPMPKTAASHASTAKSSQLYGTRGLAIVRGQARQMFRPIDGPVFMIGTAADCDLVLADSEFPETYLYIYQKENAITVRRLGVGPELYVDEMAVDATELKLGSLIEFGPYAFRLAEESAENPGNDDGPGGPDRSDDDEPFLPADFSAWELNESAAVDKVRALLADVHASLLAEREQQTLRLFGGSQAQPISSRPLRRQSA
ncbi:FHA domain-containing protein [Anatilimnocola sp. NA78]|uniref:FHA domain-containing protein n=1 Tax=Anatilimnocola sp. NA78 TaxID=3415683 RepID=UPI003CE4596E